MFQTQQVNQHINNYISEYQFYQVMQGSDRHSSNKRNQRSQDSMMAPNTDRPSKKSTYSLKPLGRQGKPLAKPTVVNSMNSSQAELPALNTERPSQPNKATILMRLAKVPKAILYKIQPEQERKASKSQLPVQDPVAKPHRRRIRASLDDVNLQRNHFGLEEEKVSNQTPENDQLSKQPSPPAVSISLKLIEQDTPAEEQQPASPVKEKITIVHPEPREPIKLKIGIPEEPEYEGRKGRTLTQNQDTYSAPKLPTQKKIITEKDTGSKGGSQTHIEDMPDQKKTFKRAQGKRKTTTFLNQKDLEKNNQRMMIQDRLNDLIKKQKEILGDIAERNKKNEEEVQKIDKQNVQVGSIFQEVIKSCADGLKSDSDPEALNRSARTPNSQAPPLPSPTGSVGSVDKNQTFHRPVEPSQFKKAQKHLQRQQSQFRAQHHITEYDPEILPELEDDQYGNIFCPNQLNIENKQTKRSFLTRWPRLSRNSSSEKTTNKEISFGTILIRKILQTVEAKRKNKNSQLGPESPEEVLHKKISPKKSLLIKQDSSSNLEGRSGAGSSFGRRPAAPGWGNTLIRQKTFNRKQTSQSIPQRQGTPVRTQGRQMTKIHRNVNYIIVQRQMDSSFESFEKDQYKLFLNVSEPEDLMLNSIYQEEILQVGYRYYMPKLFNRMLDVVLPQFEENKIEKEEQTFQFDESKTNTTNKFDQLFAEYQISIPQFRIDQDLLMIQSHEGSDDDEDLIREEMEFQEQRILDLSFSVQDTDIHEQLKTLASGIRFPWIKKILWPLLSELDEKTRNFLVEINERESNTNILTDLLNDNVQGVQLLIFQIEVVTQELQSFYNKRLSQRDRHSIIKRLIDKFDDILVGTYEDEFRYQPDPLAVIFDGGEPEKPEQDRRKMRKGTLQGRNAIRLALNQSDATSPMQMSKNRNDNILLRSQIVKGYDEKLSFKTDSVGDQHQTQAVETSAQKFDRSDSRVISMIPRGRIKLQETVVVSKQLSLEEQLFSLIRHEKCQELIDFLQHHPNVNMNYQDEDGETYLTVAAQVGDENILKQLLMRGANKLTADAKGVTPFSRALFFQNYKVADLLLKDERNLI